MVGEGPRISEDEEDWKNSVGSQSTEPLEMVGLGLADEHGRPGLRGLVHTPGMRPAHAVTPPPCSQLMEQAGLLF